MTDEIRPIPPEQRNSEALDETPDEVRPVRAEQSTPEANSPAEISITETSATEHPDQTEPDRTGTDSALTKPGAWSNPWKRVQDAAQGLKQTTVSAGKTVSQAAMSTGTALGNAAVQTGQAATETVTTVASNTRTTVAQVANQTGSAITTTAATVGNTLGTATTTATQGAGQLAHWVSRNPLFKPVTMVLKVDWLANLLDQVDVNKATVDVEKLQAKYPEESPRQIAHRLMVRKATFAAGTGLASSAVPGLAAPLLALDFSFTLSLQAELVYQIAAAYGMDLHDPARKGEILAIFGLSLGGTKAIQGGVQYASRAGVLGFLRNIPAAGAVIGSSTNAAMTYSLGYAACRFYEAKQAEKTNPLKSEAALQASEAASEEFLEMAIAQEMVMDQILMHVVATAMPDRPWQDCLPELEQLNLSPASMEQLAAAELPPLAELLAQVNPDFAAPLVSQCQKIIQLDGVVNEQEAQILQEIMAAFPDLPAPDLPESQS